MSRLFSKQKALWLLLIISSLLASLFLQVEGFPAAFLLGPMLCGIVFSLIDERLAVPHPFFLCAQALIGCAVAESITATILVSIVKDWAVMFLIVGSTVLAGALVGWILVKCRTLPGTTAAWGSAPGAASAMVVMAEAYGADARLVAVMQYLRVLVVVLTASFVAHVMIVDGVPAAAPAAHQLFSLDMGSWQTLLSTLTVVVVGGFVGYFLRIPAGAILVPMLLGGVLHAGGFVELYQPLWLKACAAVVLGWYVGLGFDRRILISAFRLLPRLLLSTVLLIILCGVSAWLLVDILHTDPLTAYLSTSPGGLESMILIAMGSQADVPFVVAVQTLRLFVVILTGPAIARLICRYA